MTGFAHSWVTAVRGRLRKVGPVENVVQVQGSVWCWTTLSWTPRDEGQHAKSVSFQMGQKSIVFRHPRRPSDRRHSKCVRTRYLLVYSLTIDRWTLLSSLVSSSIHHRCLFLRDSQPYMGIMRRCFRYGADGSEFTHLRWYGHMRGIRNGHVPFGYCGLADPTMVDVDDRLQRAFCFIVFILVVSQPSNWKIL